MKFKSEVQLEALNNATVDTDRFLVSDSSTVKYRTGAQVLSDIGGQAALTNPITGTGTTNYVSKFTGANSLGNSQIYDNGTNVGIGTTSPAYKTQIESSGADVFLSKNTSSTSFNRSYFYNNNNVGVQFLNFGSAYPFGTEFGVGQNGSVIQSNTTSMFAIGTSGAYPLVLGTSGTERMRIVSNGNVGIGTSSPTEKLEVQNAGSGAKIKVSNSAGGYASLECSSNASSVAQLSFTNQLSLIGGNVGIGTSSPSSILHLSSSVPFLNIEGSTTGSLRGIQIMQGSTVFSSLSAEASLGETRLSAGFSGWGGFQTFYTNGSEKVRITSGGNVGIGTTSPTAIGTNITTLDIKGSTGGGVRSGVAGGSESTFYTIAAGGYLGTISNIPLNFQTNNSVKATILANGNVGIGTTSPSGKFEIDGSGNFVWGFPSTAVAKIGTKGTGGSLLVSTPSLNSSYESGFAVDGTYSSGKSVINLSAFGVYSGGPYSADIAFKTSTQTVLSEKMRITSDGNVGIGTTSPTKRLDIVSSTNDSFDAIVVRPLNQTQTLNIGWQGIATSLNFIVSTNGTERMRVDTAGNVGIGTSSPSYKLQVNDTIATVTGFGNFTALQSAAGTGFRWTLNNDGTFRVQKTADGFFNISATPIMIDSSNRVGIGTTAPQRDLQVGAFSGSPEICIGSSTSGNGTLAFGDGASGNDPWRGYVQYNHSVDAMIFGTVNGEKVRITSAGYMGIGTTSPSYPLYVGTQVSNVSIYADYDIVAFSDQSVKENIRPIENALERVIESRGVLYDRIDSGEKDNIGFIAQELEVAFPELVVTNEDGTKAVKYQNAVAVLFEAVKEQQKQIDEIKRILNGITN